MTRPIRCVNNRKNHTQHVCHTFLHKNIKRTQPPETVIIAKHGPQFVFQIAVHVVTAKGRAEQGGGFRKAGMRQNVLQLKGQHVARQGAGKFGLDDLDDRVDGLFGDFGGAFVVVIVDLHERTKAQAFLDRAACCVLYLRVGCHDDGSCESFSVSLL